MSAKDPIEELIRELTDALMKEPFKRRHYAESMARSFFESHAHELAEEIRAERDAANIPGSPATPDIIRGMGDAADLIDPEVS